MMKFFILFLTLSLFNINQLFAQWDKVYKEVNGLCVAMKSNKYGFVDKNGKTVIEAKYDDAFDFKDIGLASVKIGSKFGLIDKKGNIVAAIEYDKIYGFINSMAVVLKNNMYGFINESGKLIVPTKYNDAFDYSTDGYAKVKLNSKFGLIDKTGKIIVPIEFDKVYKFSYGMAVVKKDNKYGYVNTKGKIDIPIIFDDAFDFDKNYRAKVTKDGKTGKINLAGQITWNIQIGDIINNGIVFYVDKSGRHGLICSKKDLGRLDKVRAGLAARKHEGYNSWRLPTLKEAQLMIKQADAIKTANKGFDVLSGFYWTSTEGTRGQYYAITSNQSGSLWNVSRELSVRAVKKF